MSATPVGYDHIMVEAAERMPPDCENWAEICLCRQKLYARAHMRAWACVCAFVCVHVSVWTHGEEVGANEC